MLIRKCDRCGSEDEAKPVVGKVKFKKFGTEEEIEWRMHFTCKDIDICPACQSWFMANAEWGLKRWFE